MKDVSDNLSIKKKLNILVSWLGLQDLERLVHENGGIREKEPFFLSGTSHNEASITTINPYRYRTNTKTLNHRSQSYIDLIRNG